MQKGLPNCGKNKTIRSIFAEKVLLKATGTYKKRANQGFTLMELLAGIAILIITFAISIPAVASVRSDLYMLEMDSYAKDVYLAAQNRLVSLRATGELENLNTQIERDYSARKLENIDNGRPKDYKLNDDTWKALYYLENTQTHIDPVVTVIMQAAPITEIVLEGGYYYLEMNPTSGQIYSVFYTTNPDLSYSQITALISRDRAARKTLQVGYYCGDAAESAVTPTEFSPTLTVVNKEELYATLECRGFVNLVTTQQNIKVVFEVTDEHEHTWTYTCAGNGNTDPDVDSYFSLNSNKLELELLLDSMRSGMSFSSITGNNQDLSAQLVAGDNITVTARVYYERGSTNIYGETEPITVNSLFGNRDADGNIEVKYLRQLNNLRASAYTHTDTQPITVKQTATIDFNASTWEADALSQNTQRDNLANSATRFVNPLENGMNSIENARLFGDSSNVGAAGFDGQGNLLKNFLIARGEQGTGLIGTANAITIENVTLIDPQVVGANNTGALVGNMRNGQILNCGAHLTTTDEYGRNYTENEMASRVARYNVKATGGSQGVGGLIGNATGTNINYSYAAINVLPFAGESLYSIGGLAGSVTNASIVSSYASGEVRANSYAGGLVGTLAQSDVFNCYSTSDVTTGSYGGGLFGTVSSSDAACNIISSVSYGEVLKADSTVDTATSGGFVGSSSNASYTNCNYLIQLDYNDAYSNAPANVTSKKYPELVPTDEQGTPVANPVANSHPYSWNLVKMSRVFPFAMLTRLLEDNSSVLMDHWGDWPEERKVQSSVVYYERYSDGSYGYYALTNYLELPDQDHALTLDTLRTDGSACIEDGYALLSAFELETYHYRLNEGETTAREGTLTVVEGAGNASDTTSVHLQDVAQFELLVGEKHANPLDDVYTTVQNIHIYQLPFVLQETQRDETAAFYDTLRVTGYERGIPDTPIFENSTYFYCPHFAKNAINPSDATNPDVRPADPSVISVRSARQLNALGRYSYYWNAKNNPIDNFFTFTQESDIDFNSYVKTYCGQDFDLSNTNADNPYRNMPIGRPNDDAQGFPGSFQSDYDGDGYEIIDFRVECYVEDSYQFVGLFGEFYRAELRNIVMTTSSPGNGYVRSHFNSGAHGAGVGALVGLVYIDPADLPFTAQARVTNCSAAGYDVLFAPSGTQNTNAGVGGLAGYNMGTITNCSAVSSGVKASLGDRATDTRICIAGLVGSNYGSITNSYAGGTPEYECSGTRDGEVEISGLASGFSYIWFNNNAQLSYPASITRCYSYCILTRQQNNNGQNYRDVSYHGVGFVGNRTSNGRTFAHHLTNCYYFSSSVQNGLITDNYLQREVLARNFNQLANISGLTGYQAAGYGQAELSYPITTITGTYPFPAIVTDNRGRRVHYGNWPTSDRLSVYAADGSLIPMGDAEILEDTTTSDGINGTAGTEMSGDAEKPPATSLFEEISKSEKSTGANDTTPGETGSHKDGEASDSDTPDTQNEVSDNVSNDTQNETSDNVTPDTQDNASELSPHKPQAIKGKDGEDA